MGAIGTLRSNARKPPHPFPQPITDIHLRRNPESLGKNLSEKEREPTTRQRNTHMASPGGLEPRATLVGGECSPLCTTIVSPPSLLPLNPPGLSGLSVWVCFILQKLGARKSWNDVLDSSRGNRRKGMEREQAFLQFGQVGFSLP